MAVHLLSDVDVVAISLVDKGANKRKFYLRKKEEGWKTEEEFEIPGPARLVKTDDWSTVYCVVAEPGWRENPGVGASTDLEDEWASPDEIRKAAHKFMRNGALVNKMHETLDPYGSVVENFVAQSTFLVGEELVKEGAWLVGIEPTEEGKLAIEKGEFTGISIQGSGVRKLVEKGDPKGAEGPDAKKCPSCGGTVKADVKTCQNCGHSFVSKAELTAAGRKKLPTGAFVFPKEKRYPIHDKAHAANALARSSGKPEEATVKRVVCSRYPDLPACQIKKVAGPPGTDISRNQAAARGPLRHLIAFYMKKPHPFTACVRDNTKRFGPERAKRVCATLKDLGTGTTKWRHGGKQITKAEDIPDELLEFWWLSLSREGLTKEDIEFIVEGLEKQEGTLRSVEDHENTGWLRAIGIKLGISKEEAEQLVDEETGEEEAQVSEASSDERLTKMEESIEKTSKDVKALADRLADIAEKLAGKNKEEEEAPPPDPTAEVYHRLEEVSKSLDELTKDVEKLSEGSTSQENGSKKEPVSKSDHPLAGLLFEE
jgi:uncharacterized coiled-coil protein SlyX